MKYETYGFKSYPISIRGRFSSNIHEYMFVLLRRPVKDESEELPREQEEA